MSEVEAIVEQPEIQVEATEEKKPEIRSASPISIDPKSKMMVAKDSAEMMRMLSIFMKGNTFPKSIDSPAKCATAWNLACSLLPRAPQRAVARMMYVNNVLGIWGELPKALAEETKELEDFELFVVDEKHDRIGIDNKNLNSEVYAAVCKIKRKGRTKNEYYFTMDEAKRAGLLNKTSPWTQGYAKAMLCWRAQGMGLKFEFADALMGTEIIEYRFNEFPEIKDVASSGDLADKINKTYLEKAEG